MSIALIRRYRFFPCDFMTIVGLIILSDFIPYFQYLIIVTVFVNSSYNYFFPYILYIGPFFKLYSAIPSYSFSIHKECFRQMFSINIFDKVQNVNGVTCTICYDLKKKHFSSVK